ncbi:MAG: glycosyltransferase family 2 protein [Gemmatimonadetes bacterium]|nr:glycosyltransferase family 2 protein [Gemmatimonadota bacterium]
MLTLDNLLLALPWIALALLQPVLIRRRPALNEHAPPPDDEAPLASIIVPARDEARNIGPCVASLLATRYPRFEILIVNDRSTDGTGDIVRALAEHHPDRIRVIEGRSLPDGWTGKNWACWQGYRDARGQVLLFTDADTHHHERLLGLAVGALRDSGAAFVTLLPRQLMIGFWERVILPHVFTAILLRYRDLRRMNRTSNPRNVIANGQFILFSRESYQAVGGHEAVRGDIVEDLGLAQRVVASGRRIYGAHAHDLMDTRMYRSLADIVEGWTKNLASASRQSVPAPLRLVLPWAIGAFMLLFWVAPPILVSARVSAPPAVPLLATIASVAFWVIAYHRFGGRRAYALLYPLGALATALLFFRSAARGARVTWKGRTYETGGTGRVGGPAS